MAQRSPSQLNLLLGVDKPVGCTSHDVVARLRRSLSERRVGHAGTLDPAASGVMVIGVGQATRLLGSITLDSKSYVAAISFGCETNTDDAEGEVTRSASVPRRLLDRDVAGETVSRLVGTHMQVPPAFSAISVGGVRSYKRARAGEDVELPAREIEVISAVLLDVAAEGDGCVWTVAFTVSKGTYIRALARDLGRSLGSAAHLSALRRTTSGSVSLGECIALDDASPDLARERALDPVHVLGLPAVAIGEAALADVLCGRRLSPALLRERPELLQPGSRMCLVANDELRAIAQFDGRAVVMKEVFPQGIGGVRL